MAYFYTKTAKQEILPESAESATLFLSVTVYVHLCYF